MRTVSFFEFLDHGRNILHEYVERDHVTAADEQAYLLAIRRHVKTLQDYLGARALCTILSDHDLDAFTTFPKKLRVYRGYYEPEKREGISWSLSRKVAEGFAYAGRNPETQPPMVVTGVCAISKILAYTNDRREEEIVIAPEHVQSIRNIKVRRKPRFPVSAEPLAKLLKWRQHHGSEVIRAI